MIIFDNLSELKQVANSDAFMHVEATFQKEKERYLKKMLNPETSDQETLNLKAVLNALDLMSPKKLAEATLIRASKKLKSRHPEIFK